MKWIIEDLEQLNEVVSAFLAHTGKGTIFALYGQMGVGKTTFVKAVAKSMGMTDEVNSPTFSIVNEYRNRENEWMYHFDFYRINDVSEALDFGYEEYFYSGNKCFIEWPEKIEELLPEYTIRCYFSELPDGKRQLVI